MEDVEEVGASHVPDTRHYYIGNTSVRSSQVNTLPQALVPSNGECKEFNCYVRIKAQLAWQNCRQFHQNRRQFIAK